MDRGSYELTFEVAPLTDDLEDAIADAFECVIASHSDVTTVTLTAHGRTCVAAALGALEEVRLLGADVRRLVDDLVGRREIARRAGVTPQAVGLWVRGERHAGAPFPPPFVLAGGGLWLWGEVLPALASRGVALGDDIGYPSRHDAQVIGGAIAASQTSGASVWEHRMRLHTAAFTMTRPATAIPMSVASAELATAS
ncbi:MAG TPA: hypothetical protein VES02_02465 [Dermatophilaceae bacterium]|nr:hypothetical protein [Dermatophilaceae bacterium]